MKKALSVVAILSLVFSPVTPVFAGSASWVGGTDGAWKDAGGGNWSNAPLAEPGTGDTATFDAGFGSAPLGVIDLTTGVTIKNIAFDNTGGTLASYTIGAGGANNDTLTLDASGTITMNATIGAGLDQTFDCSIILSGAGTFSNTSASELIFNGTVDGTTVGTESLAISGGDVTLAGIGTTTALGSLTITTSGVTTLGGDVNTDNSGGDTGDIDLSGATGGITLSAGGLVTLDSVGAGTGGDVDLSGSDVDAATLGVDSLAVNAGGGAVTLAGIGTTTGLGYVDVTAGAINLGGDITTDTTGGQNGHITITGPSTLTAAVTLTSGTGNITLADVNNGGFLLTVNNTGASNSTITGVISNTGGLTKDGTGTLTLSGVNTYTGVTTISGGTLSVATIGNGGVAGNLGKATNAVGNQVLDGGTLSYTGATASTDRGFTVNATGGGIDVTTAGNTLTFDTTGIVTTAGGTLTFGGAGNAAVSSVISGGGAITMGGIGTLTLSGVNTYTGVTTISGGTLSVATIGNGGVAGNLGKATNAVGNQVLDGGTLSYTGATASTDRGFTVNATGGEIDVTTAGNTLTFNTTGIATTAGGTLTFGGAGNAAVSSVISGGGAVTMGGTGTLTFSNSNTYTGATTINAGGTLAYTNTVTSASAHTNNGTLAIGFNTLTLTGANAYTQNAGSTLNLGITNAANYGKIVAAGAAAGVNAGSTVNVTVGGAFIAGGTPFTIVDGGGAVALGVPGTITSTSLIVDFTGDVTSSLGDLILVAVRSHPYNTLVTGANNQAAAVALEQAGKEGPTGDMLTVLNTLDSMTSAKAINDAISTMIPDVSSGALQASRALANMFFGSIGNRLGFFRNGTVQDGVATGDAAHGVGFWLQGLGSNIKQDTRGMIGGYQANLFGTTIGVDKLLDDHIRVGLAGGFGFANVNSKTAGNPGTDVESWQGTFYGSYDSLRQRQGDDIKRGPQGGVRNPGEDSWYVDGMFGFTQDNYDSRREIWLTSTDKRVAKADHHGQEYSTKFEAGYTFVFEKTKKLEVTPFASLGYSYLYMNQYSESGANALNLRVDGKGFNQLEQGLGTKFAYPIAAKKVGTFIPSVKAAWLFDYIEDRFETRASFTGGGPSFATQGAKPARNGCLVGGELAFLNKGNMTLTGNYDLELKDEYISNTYYATARFDF